MVTIAERIPIVGTDTVLFEHEGTVDKEMLLDSLPTIEQVLESRGVARQKRRKIISIAIEALQNLQLHGTEAGYAGRDGQPVFIVSENANELSVITCNAINAGQAYYLKDKLLKINSLTEDEIRYLYSVIMRQTVVKFSPKGGAGLGLVDMKKKSGNNLSYDFRDLTPDLSYFCLRVSVPRKDDE